MTVASKKTGGNPAKTAVQLEAVLDLGAAERLHAQLMGLRGQPIDIDASKVERLGGLCLQVLLAARKSWAADGQDVQLSASSPAFEDAWTLFAALEFSPELQPL